MRVIVGSVSTVSIIRIGLSVLAAFRCRTRSRLVHRSCQCLPKQKPNAINAKSDLACLPPELALPESRWSAAFLASRPGQQSGVRAPSIGRGVWRHGGANPASEHEIARMRSRTARIVSVFLGLRRFCARAIHEKPQATAVRPSNSGAEAVHRNRESAAFLSAWFPSQEVCRGGLSQC